MRIAYMCADFGIPIHGSKGAAIHVRELSQAMQRLRHDVLIVASRAGGPPPPRFAVPVYEVGLAPAEQFVYEALRDDPNAGEAIAREVRSSLAATAIAARSREFLRDFQPDAIYERYALFCTAGVALAREFKIPHIVEINAPLSAEQARHRGLAFGQTARAVERMILTSADRVIAVSDQLAEWLTGIGVDPNRITVLPNGVDPDRFAAGAIQRDAVRAELGLRPNQPLVGFVGTLKAWHGTATLLQAFALLRRSNQAQNREPRLLIVDEGPERAGLEDLRDRRGSPRRSSSPAPSITTASPACSRRWTSRPRPMTGSTTSTSLP